MYRCECRVAAVTHSWRTFLIGHLTNTSGQGLWAGGLGLSMINLPPHDSVTVEPGTVHLPYYLHVLHIVGTLLLL